MRCVIPAGLALCAVLNRLPADDVPTPAERYKALAAAWKQANDRYYQARDAAKGDAERAAAEKLWPATTAKHHAPGFVALVREHPADPAALDAFRWLMRNNYGQPENGPAADALVAHCIGQPGMAELCRSVNGGSPDPAVMKLLRAVSDNSPSRDARGQASFALAESFLQQPSLAKGEKPPDHRPAEAEAEKLLQQVVERYADLEHTPKVTLGQAAARHLYVVRELAVGKPAPEIEGVDLAGEKFKLSDARGKVVLLAFTGTWCGPCMRSVPGYAELTKSYAGKPFAVVGVNSDKDAKAAAKEYADLGLTWRAFWDGGSYNGPIATAWRVDRWPTLYLLDAKGVIRHRGAALSATGLRKLPSGVVQSVPMAFLAVAELMKELEPKGP